jgi:hypothetical protein
MALSASWYTAGCRAKFFIFITLEWPSPKRTTLSTHTHPGGLSSGGTEDTRLILWHLCLSPCRYWWVWERLLQWGLCPWLYQHPGELQVHLLWWLHAGTRWTQLPGWVVCYALPSGHSLPVSQPSMQNWELWGGLPSFGSLY